MYDEVTGMERKLGKYLKPVLTSPNQFYLFFFLAELESSRKELEKQQETLQSKIQHQFTGQPSL